MTIIRPSKQKNLSYFILFLFFILVGGGIFIFQYNNYINFKHELQNINDQIQKLSLQNADFKNQLYKITDVNNLKQAAINVGLILENNPEYLKLQG
ncbi:MAG: hypothetical protein ACP5IC_00030 [Minisyncoccia bacterium]